MNLNLNVKVLLPEEVHMQHLMAEQPTPSFQRVPSADHSYISRSPFGLCGTAGAYAICDCCRNKYGT